MLYSGMSSLEIGGRLVFFTYSMNPVEAEAVAYAVIMQQRGIHFNTLALLEHLESHFQGISLLVRENVT